MKYKTFFCIALLVLCSLHGPAVQAVDASTSDKILVNTWVKLDVNQVGPRTSGALIWSQELKRFVLIGGAVSHGYRKERPYDIMSFDLTQEKWINEIPKGGEAWGGENGPVKSERFKSPYMAMVDKAGVVRPHPYHFNMHFQYTYAPWNKKFYTYLCGWTLEYDPQARIWKDLNPAEAPLPKSKFSKTGYSWGSLCADPVNKELVLFGGSADTERGGPGTWIFSPEKNTWKDLGASVQPPVRVLSQMAFDGVSQKIVLFGGDRLDQLYADTWVYDCKRRTWEERKPVLSPSPRFGHNLVYLPKSRSLLLLGGKTYTSRTDYFAMLYAPLPFEVWKYDVLKNTWSLVKHWPRVQKNANVNYPNQSPVHNSLVAVNANDELVYIDADKRYSKQPHATWCIHIDSSKVDAAEGKLGVKPGTLTVRDKSYDPDWYRDVPDPDTKKTASFYKNITSNTLVEVKAPKWPMNRMVGGWSTVAFDSDRDQLLHIGGGHSSYSGNDVAHFDIKTGRWSISNRPMFALEYNYGIGVRCGEWSFDHSPWPGNHQYHCYTYAPHLEKMVKINLDRLTYYDPDTRKWPLKERSQKITQFRASGYTTFMLSTPDAVYAWGIFQLYQPKAGLFKLTDKNEFIQLKTIGDEKVPESGCDKSTMCFDSRKQQLIMMTTPSKKSAVPMGQVWIYDMKSSVLEAKNPKGMKQIVGKTFARESVYLPKSKLVMLGYLLEIDEKLQVPFYDTVKNAWFVADIPGSKVINRGKPGASVDLGLTYDAKRDLIWLTLCRLHPGSLQIMRIDMKSLKLTPLE